MVQYEILKKFTAYDFIQVGFIIETCSKRNNGTLVL